MRWRAVCASGVGAGRRSVVLRRFSLSVLMGGKKGAEDRMMVMKGCESVLEVSCRVDVKGRK